MAILHSGTSILPIKIAFYYEPTTNSRFHSTVARSRTAGVGFGPESRWLILKELTKRDPRMTIESARIITDASPPRSKA
jgi:hypothetical protein